MGRLHKAAFLLFLTLTAEGLAQSETHRQPHAGSPSTPGPVRKGRVIWREWRRGDPTLINSLWKSKTPLGNAEPYIVLALLIGFLTVVIGCWLSDNCWSPEPEQLAAVA